MMVRCGGTRDPKQKANRELRGSDKIRPYYVRRKDTKDTVGRYIVLLPEEKTDICQHDSE